MNKENLPGDDRSNDWKRYQDHREMVTNMLRESMSFFNDRTDISLAIWGAGKCNDVDLNLLSDKFSSITLVDIVDNDLNHAVQQQGCADNDKIRLLGRCDLSGVDRLLNQYAATQGSELLTQIGQQAAAFSGPDLKPSHVTVSNAMLTQLTDKVLETIGDGQPGFAETMLAIRNRHLDLLIEHTLPGGIAFLVTDVVSSMTIPELAEPVEDLTAVVKQAIAESNFFHGANPAAILDYYHKHSPNRKRLVRVDPSEPWIWDGPGDLHRAVVAIRLTIAD